MRYCLLLVFALLFTTIANGQITGTATVCTGATTALSCSTPPGGTWSSSDTTVARINSSGIVTGINAGTATITYQLMPTVHTRIVTVNLAPAPITGSASLCVGTSITYTCATTGGTWSSSEPAVATVSATTGYANPLMPGTTAIQYTLSSGCSTSTAVTVNAIPDTMLGPSSVCVGGSVTLTSATPGGTWISGSTGVATIGSTSGMVAGIAPGTTPITYRLVTTGCYRARYFVVNALPSAISGPTGVCVGSFATLSATPSGGVWTSSNPAVGSIHSSTGVVTGNTAGTVNISYTLPSTGCATGRVQTVSVMPGAILGTPVVCPGATITLANSVGGGSWASGTTSVATVGVTSGPTTSVLGMSAGTAIISYYTSPACVATVVATVSPAPSAGTILGGSTVCVSTSVTLSSTVSGGTWSTPSSAVTVGSATGVVTGVSTGTANITYIATNSCGTTFTVAPITVSALPGAITGPATLCAGTTVTLTNGVPGGTWSTSSVALATIGMSSGVLTGVSGGTVGVTYAIAPSCQATTVVTVSPAPSPISGPDSVCVGSLAPLSDTASGGVWTSSAPSVATVGVIGVSTGMVSGIAAGTAIITYAIGGCNAYKIMVVNALPVITASSAPDACGTGFSLGATGGVSYSWAPTTGVACPTCAGTSVAPIVSTTYTVTGTNASGCSATDTVVLGADRVYGHISFSGPTPAVPDLLVWLVRYNPADSTITAVDSLATCLDGSTPYFQFSGKPAGNYLVKAKLFSSVPGTSDFMPTYGDSATSWTTAATVVHTTGASNARNITMKFGTVPAGPGFIGGNVYSGAGKGTAGTIPERGMLIYLKDAATGVVLTYAYTNADGAYSFTGIALGSYIIYPEETGYYTTPSAVVTLSAASASAIGISFKKNTTLHTIYPFTFTGIGQANTTQDGVSIYPNPASGMVNIDCAALRGDAQLSIADVTGHTLITTSRQLDGTALQMDVSTLANGIYILNVTSGSAHISRKLVIAR
ncbi:hypothetical protein GCM10023093_30210 [Nemorincola caseinilytica]|uniref:BIG2 domain-containing protein n=1 Tax=Nemorincola caseinilytica TaxID=2054315 RepID=A0ABP8NN39_9BACT